jgi:hypothetical protein
MISPRFLPITLLLALLIICGAVPKLPQARAGAAEVATKVGEPAVPAATIQAGTPSGCLNCHPFELNSHQQLSCVSCHDGNDRATTREVAHVGLDSTPAAPDRLQEKCGPCHTRQTKGIEQSRHFTLSGEVNPVRRHFGAKQDLASALEIPLNTAPATPLELADDLLRRRCLSCHVYYRGDEYGLTRHGTGCAACHLDYRDGKMISHRFLTVPNDRRCLACHYGNRVGGDYYGFFEHDLRHDYRTPFQSDGSYPERPYGVEEHQLLPDVHRQAGLTCLDCHSGLHQGKARTIACTACHEWRAGQALPSVLLQEKDNQLLLKLMADGRLLPVPRAIDPAHSRFGRDVDCAVCHAQWSYNDRNTHLLRTDVEDYQDWDDLIVQGSSEVESALLNSLYGDREEEPGMSDKFTGTDHLGLWLKTYELRRWENPPLGRDSRGRLRVLRPSLDLHLSWVDEQGQTVFDSTGGPGTGMRPYTPHTMGKAGPFYWQRLQGFIPAANLGISEK